MQNCLGIYIENNLIKYAKVSKEKDNCKVESYGIKFYENLNEAVNTILEETFSFNTPISINLANERYLYFDIFSLLSKEDVKKSIQIEYEAYCEEHKYNQNAFETRYTLAQNIQNKEKIRAIEVIVNKIELNKQKQYLEKKHLSKILPIGVAISSIAKIDKNENVLIVNMEEKTNITSILNMQVYNVDILDEGSEEVLEKINQIENSMKKSYEICKQTTIYTSDIVEETTEQPYLEYIVPTLYKISQKVQQIVNDSPLKISTVYLTGTLSVVNNVDLYFQEFLPSIDCKILRPDILEGTATQINIKDYIEVNSAISLAMHALKDTSQSLNFKKADFKARLNEILNMDVSLGTNKDKLEKKKSKPKKELDFSFNKPLEMKEQMLIRAGVALILINIIFIVFSSILYKQMENKQDDIKSLIMSENAQIQKMNNDINSLNSKNTKYQSLIADLKTINQKISSIAESKNSIPNLLNQIMFVIPETVQLTSIQNTTEKKVVIVANASDYDQLGYFIAKIKVDGILKNTVSSSGQKSSDTVTVTIEGELP